LNVAGRIMTNSSGGGKRRVIDSLRLQLDAADIFPDDGAMSAAHPDRLLDEIADLCTTARRILFITGAGISADSGLPTYRGIGGLYDRNLTDEGFLIEEALSGDMLAQRPEITWKYLAQIEATCRGVRPNVAHETIAWLEAERGGVTVLTQNVDGLHRAAGSRDLIEIHGTLHQLVCTECGRRITVPDYVELAMPPACPECDGLVRPDVVLFGEALPLDAVKRLVSTLEDGVDLVFSIGTTSVFPYIAEPVLDAVRRGVPTVEINPGETCVSDAVDFRLAMGAAQALGEIRRRMER
jgi:NAD-dependent deacetylase